MGQKRAGLQREPAFNCIKFYILKKKRTETKCGKC